MTSRRNLGFYHSRINNSEVGTGKTGLTSKEEVTRRGQRSMPIVTDTVNNNSKTTDILITSSPQHFSPRQRPGGSTERPRKEDPDRPTSIGTCLDQRAADLGLTGQPKARTLFDILSESLNCEWKKLDEAKILFDAECLELTSLQKAMKDAKQNQEISLNVYGRPIIAPSNASGQERPEATGEHEGVGGILELTCTNPFAFTVPETKLRDDLMRRNNVPAPAVSGALRRRLPLPDPVVRPLPVKSVAIQSQEESSFPARSNQCKRTTFCSTFKGDQELDIAERPRLTSEAKGQATTKQPILGDKRQAVASSSKQPPGESCWTTKRNDEPEVGSRSSRCSTSLSFTRISRSESPDTLRDKLLLRDLREMTLLRELNELVHTLPMKYDTSPSSSEESVQKKGTEGNEETKIQSRTAAEAAESGTVEVDDVDKRIRILEEALMKIEKEGRRYESMRDEATQTAINTTESITDVFDKPVASLTDLSSGDRDDHKAKCYGQIAHVSDSIITQVSSIWPSNSATMATSTDPHGIFAETDAANTASQQQQPLNADHESLMHTISSELLSASIPTDRLKAALLATTGGKPLDENGVLMAIEHELSDINLLLNGSVNFLDLKPAEFLQMHVRKLKKFTTGLEEFLQEQKNLACI